MTMPLTHDIIDGRGLVERYVAGRLTDEEAVAFEAHYLTCQRCQDEVRLAAAVRAELPSAPAARRSRPIWIGATLAAAGLAGLLLLTARRPTAELVRLGQVVEPPVYLGIPVRATPAPADTLFEAAMRTYAAHQYDAAVTGLAAALAAGTDSAPAEFFRSASLLMLHQDEAAAAGFRRVVALGSTPYLPESHFYLAKALLRLRRADEAVAELQSLAGAGIAIRDQANALADSARAALR